MIAFWMEMVICNHFFHGKDLRTIIQPKQPAKKGSHLLLVRIEHYTLCRDYNLELGRCLGCFLRISVKPMDLLGHGLSP